MTSTKSLIYLYENEVLSLGALFCGYHPTVTANTPIYRTKRAHTSGIKTNMKKNIAITLL